MPLFRRRFRVKARESRGEGQTPTDALKEQLVTNYDDTKADYDAMYTDMQESFREALGAQISDAFINQGATIVDM